MSCTSYVRGRPVVWDGLVYRWCDTGEPVTVERCCPKCGETAADRTSPDPCLGHIPGVVSACCGHGVTEPYQYTSADLDQLNDTGRDG